MSEKQILELKVAEFLLKIQAVQLNPQNPFTWASGLRSPIYCDNRKIMSFPEIRNEIADAFVEVIRQFPIQPEIIAGVATGGIGIGALVADRMNLPFVYVRAEAKKHGLTNQIEGVCPSGAKVMVIEDLISTGKSSYQAIEALQERKVELVGMVAIFTYLFPDAIAKFQDLGFKVKTLSNYDVLLQQAVMSQYIQEETVEALREWKHNPVLWSEKFNQALS
jgi:orotate phosphoribosyltransferase